MKEIKSTFLEDEAYTVKTVFMMEVRPLSDVFEQVMLSREEMRKVNDLVATFMTRCKKCKGFQITTNDKYRVKLQDIPYAYEEKDYPDRNKCSHEDK